MSGNRFIRRGLPADREPKLGRAFLVSFGLHLFILLIFSGLILPEFGRDRRPVYYVDLVNLPVENPQAGRPDAAPKSEKKKPAAKKSSPVQKSSAVVSTKPVAPPRGPSDADIAAKIDRMQQQSKSKKEIDELKNKLAALASQDSRGEDAAPDAPVGMPEGTGDEVGISDMAWLQAYLKSQWAFSKYQATRLDLEAVVLIDYDRDGNLVDMTFLKKSNDSIFNDSVRAAILKSRKLPLPPPVRYRNVEVKFNLKELLN